MNHLTAWDSTAYDALAARERARTRRSHAFRNGLLLGTGFWLLVWLVYTVAVEMVR